MLPFLSGDQLVARMDARVDGAGSTLSLPVVGIEAAYQERSTRSRPSWPTNFVLATLLELDRVVVEGPGDLDAGAARVKGAAPGCAETNMVTGRSRPQSDDAPSGE